jgi:hypothetical protein
MQGPQSAPQERIRSNAGPPQAKGPEPKSPPARAAQAGPQGGGGGENKGAQHEAKGESQGKGEDKGAHKGQGKQEENK